MAAETDWADVAADFMSARSPNASVAGVLQQLTQVHPIAISTALSLDQAERAKPDAMAFLLFAIRRAVADHALSGDEMTSLRHLSRVLRVEEGDLLASHPEEVRDLLCQELQRLLEDHSIDPAEAIHKVKLQELMGLGYDQFIALTRPVIQDVIAGILRNLGADSVAGLSAERAPLFQKRLAALDSVYDLS